MHARPGIERVTTWGHGPRKRAVFLLLALGVSVETEPPALEMTYTAVAPEVTTAPSPDIEVVSSSTVVERITIIPPTTRLALFSAAITATTETPGLITDVGSLVLERVSVVRSAFTPAVKMLSLSEQLDPANVYPPQLTMTYTAHAPTVSVFDVIPAALSDDGKWEPPGIWPARWPTTAFFLDQTPVSISPYALAMTYTAIAPTVSTSQNTIVAAPRLQMTYTAIAPTIRIFGAPNIRPPALTMTYAVNAPTGVPPAVVPPGPDKVGGDDAYHHQPTERRVVYEKQNTGRAKLRLKKEQQITEEIAEIYRKLTAEPATARAAETIVAPVVAPLEADTAPLNAPPTRELPPIERQAEVLRVKADAGEAEAVDAEIALRLLYQQWREAQEQDDQAALELLLRFLV